MVKDRTQASRKLTLQTRYGPADALSQSGQPRPNPWVKQQPQPQPHPVDKRTQAPEDPSSFAPPSGEHGQQISANSDKWPISKPPPPNEVLEVIKQRPHWEDDVRAKQREHENISGVYWHSVTTKISALLDLTHGRDSIWVVPHHWQPHPQRRNGRELPDRLQPGDLIEVAHHTSSRDSPTASLLDPNEMPTIWGPVYTKRRTIIVVELFQSHAECVPIYSHNGNGLKGKSDDEKKEFFAIQEKGHKWESEAHRDKLLYANGPSRYENGRFLKKNSYVKFTERMPHRHTAMCKVVGNLDIDSWRRLSSHIKNCRCRIRSTER